MFYQVVHLQNNHRQKKIFGIKLFVKHLNDKEQKEDFKIKIILSEAMMHREILTFRI